jgi:hypothetical protein
MLKGTNSITYDIITPIFVKLSIYTKQEIYQANLLFLFFSFDMINILSTNL